MLCCWLKPGLTDLGSRGDLGQGWRGASGDQGVGIVGIQVKEWGVGRGDSPKSGPIPGPTGNSKSLPVSRVST